eukprot:TRINITY_DN38987_c0_g1_i6.p2 TRINITY_DN38987_c0_g1~~TRINITY_DN38987_c0_g1_i6.p2  ORF type:complete len:126 (-),score=17.46 TRINITY_DN38987_c0_g1_i6:137-514(-)
MMKDFSKEKNAHQFDEWKHVLGVAQRKELNEEEHHHLAIENVKKNVEGRLKRDRREFVNTLSTKIEQNSFDVNVNLLGHDLVVEEGVVDEVVVVVRAANDQERVNDHENVHIVNDEGPNHLIANY